MEEVQTFAAVAVIIVGLVGSLALIAVLTTRALMGGARKQGSLPEADKRLDQLQLSVDTIAVEVERIAESQRFSTRLLAERGEDRALPH
jgi:hypothetical protein